jgi:hypothetical protein
MERSMTDSSYSIDKIDPNHHQQGSRIRKVKRRTRTRSRTRRTKCKRKGIPENHGGREAILLFLDPAWHPLRKDRVPNTHLRSFEDQLRSDPKRKRAQVNDQNREGDMTFRKIYVKRISTIKIATNEI